MELHQGRLGKDSVPEDHGHGIGCLGLKEHLDHDHRQGFCFGWFCVEPGVGLNLYDYGSLPNQDIL